MAMCGLKSLLLNERMAEHSHLFRLDKLNVNKMLYSKEKGSPRRRSYEHLHIHTSKEQAHRLRAVGRVMLNGKVKK